MQRLSLRTLLTRWALLALALLAMVTLSCRGHAASGDGLAQVRARGELRWGGDTQGGEPYVFDDPQRPGVLVGFEVDLAAALARRLGVRATFVQNDWSNLVPSLERGSFDVILNGLEVTPSRAGRVLFTRPYYLFRMRLMARTGDQRVLTTPASLRGLRVGTLSNSQSYDWLVSQGIQPVLYEGQEEPYIDLQNGRNDAVLLDDIIATRYGIAKPGLTVVGDVGDGYYAAAVRSTDATLHQALDTAMQQVIVSGELQQILARWHIDDARETRLSTWSTDDQARLTQRQAPARFQMGHLTLFAHGAFATLVVSVLAMLFAVPLGMLLALVRMYGPKPLAWACISYIELIRGTPVLLQLYVIYYGLAGVVQLGPIAAAVLGLALNYGAYEAEVYRAGLQAVPKGQHEAAIALGMSKGLALRRVIVPQAFRIALPGVTNDFIALLKDSSLVSVITVVELTKRMTITAVELRSWLIPGLLCAAMYFAMSFPLSRLSQRLEKRLARA
jgi:polar amino acid transport system substrate-binding protein